VNFLEIQNAVIADRFDQSDRGDIKNWINDCYDTIVSGEEWTFKTATDPVTVTANSSTVTGLPSDLGVVLELARADGTPLEYLTSAVFENTYYGITTTGIPQHYTLYGATVKVGPVSSETSTAYQLLYEKDQTPLSADADVPILPTGTHMALVYGAAAIGLMLREDPNGPGLEQKFDKRLAQMRRRYLVTHREKQRQSPAYRP